MRRFRILTYDDGRAGASFDTLDTAATAAPGFLRAFYARNRHAPRGGFKALGPDADGGFDIYTKTTSVLVERYLPLRRRARP